MAETVKKGARITGADRAKLGTGDPPSEPAPTDVMSAEPVVEATELEE